MGIFGGAPTPPPIPVPPPAASPPTMANSQVANTANQTRQRAAAAAGLASKETKDLNPPVSTAKNSLLGGGG